MRWPLNVAEIGHDPPRPGKQTELTVPLKGARELPLSRNVKVEVES
jgi:hypothetical protein